MSRQLRLEYPGALFHVIARGNAKQRIFCDDDDRARLLALLSRCVDRFRWILTAYVLMPNHIHLLLQLTEETLSAGMQWLNGAYAIGFNRRHARVGHLFQGRFKAHLVEKQAYNLEVARYVVLNPVRAKIVAKPEDYEWSSHRAVMGIAPAPSWLAVDDLLAQFGGDRQSAREHYREFVHSAIGQDANPWKDLTGQIYLGREEWVKSVRERVELKPRVDEFPLVQRTTGLLRMHDVVSAVASTLQIAVDQVRAGRGVPRLLAAWVGSNEARLTNREIAAGLRLRSEGSVRRLIVACEKELSGNAALRRWLDQAISTIRGKNCELKV